MLTLSFSLLRFFVTHSFSPQDVSVFVCMLRHYVRHMLSVCVCIVVWLIYFAYKWNVFRFLSLALFLFLRHRRRRCALYISFSSSFFSNQHVSLFSRHAIAIPISVNFDMLLIKWNTECLASLPSYTYNCHDFERQSLTSICIHEHNLHIDCHFAFQQIQTLLNNPNAY